MSVSSEFVRPLGKAENRFLQVLVTQFALRESGGGTELSLQFDDTTPVIWTGRAKEAAKKSIRGFSRVWPKVQAHLDAVLLDHTRREFAFDNPAFPFRYGSGGVLPVLRMGKREYVALFYRDIYPVGWNIANGATDSRAELLYPLTTVEREFREELLVLKPPRQDGARGGRRYVFEWEAGRSEERAEYAMARRLWARVFPGWDVERFEQLRLPVQWLQGPDTIAVTMKGWQPHRSSGCFLNVNAEDFGIEVDRIAKIFLPEDVVLLDGEIIGEKVLDRPVGLFAVEALLAQLGSQGSQSFLPEFFFLHGRRYEGSEFASVIDKDVLPALPELRTKPEVDHFKSLKNRFGLCPVTRSLLRRYAAFMLTQSPSTARTKVHPPRTKRAKKFEVFISFADADEPLARRVFDYVRTVKRRSAFFYKDYMVSRWGRLQDDALDSADCLIVVGTDVDQLRRGWPEHEWVAFLNAINIERKPGGQFIPFVVGITRNQVPMSWLPHQIIFGDGDLDGGLRTLGKVMDGR